MATQTRRNAGYRSYKSKQLATYLRTEAERANGELYVNGDRLAADLDQPPKDIERRIRELSGTVTGLRIDFIPDSPRPLWRVSRVY